MPRSEHDRCDQCGHRYADHDVRGACNYQNLCRCLDFVDEEKRGIEARREAVHERRGVGES